MAILARNMRTALAWPRNAGLPRGESVFLAEYLTRVAELSDCFAKGYVSYTIVLNATVLTDETILCT
jgi:hypothetical protein